MIDNLLGDDDGEIADESDEEMGGLFDDAGGAGDDGGEDLTGGDDDLMDGDDDLMGGGEEMGFDDMDDDGAATNSEMNNRIDELENEVASLSSTVNTVKSENEQISNSLDDVEENIRKLLEVYEMVTRGVNPFVNEDELGDAFGGGAGGAGGGGGGSMGLFGDDEEESQSAEIDDSVANADADDFFDDDLEVDDEAPGLEEFEEEGADESADDGGADSGGKSFEELKSEYESGEANWDDGAGEVDDAGDDLEAELLGDDGDDADDPDDEAETDSDLADDLGPDDSPLDEFEGGAADAADGDADPEAPTSGSDGTSDGLGAGAADDVADGKPYLDDLPPGYVADVVVMDWLEFLVDEAGIDGAARTIAYYEAIDWLSATAAETLQTYLRGFGDEVETDPEPRSSLTVGHHNVSLRFVSRIADPSTEMVDLDGRPRPEAGDRHRPEAPPAPSTEPGNPPGDPTPPRATELESDGGRRTAVEGGAPDYDPASAGRRAERPRREAHSDENDSGSDDEKTGLGGFYWNGGQE